MKKTGILLVNIGTPNNPEPEAVGKYLTEFLMDPYVIDIPYALRWFLVNVLIVPKRKTASSLLYKKVWKDTGSPLLHYSKSFTEKLKTSLGDSFSVKLGMRYGSPNIATALAEMAEEHVEELILVPLYPQFSYAATTSSIVKTNELVKDFLGNIKVKIVPPFYLEESFLSSFESVSRSFIEKKNWDKVLFSFHGLPERQVKRTDPTGLHCKSDKSCCVAVTENNQDCYRAQCYETARQLARRLNLKEEDYLVAFQSRLGRTPWIKPHSDEYYRTLPAQGVKRLLVISPSFVTDCLETLEEIQIRGKEEFCENGGQELTLVPSLNDSQVWVDGFKSMVLT